MVPDSFMPRMPAQRVSHRRAPKIRPAAIQKRPTAASSRRAPAIVKKKANTTTATERIPWIMRSPAGDRFSITKPAATPVSRSSRCSSSVSTTMTYANRKVAKGDRGFVPSPPRYCEKTHPMPAPSTSAPPISRPSTSRASSEKGRLASSSGVTRASVSVKSTITTTSFTIVTPRTTSTSGPSACFSSMTATVRSGEELAAHTPSSSAIAMTPCRGSSARNGVMGLTAITTAATPTHTTAVMASVVIRIVFAWGRSASTRSSPPASMAISASANRSIRPRSETASAGRRPSTEGPTTMPITMKPVMRGSPSADASEPATDAERSTKPRKIARRPSSSVGETTTKVSCVNAMSSASVTAGLSRRPAIRGGGRAGVALNAAPGGEGTEVRPRGRGR